MLIDRNDLPNRLFGIPDLDLSGDLCAESLAGPWFRLGACSTGSGCDGQGVENVVYRQSMLLAIVRSVPLATSPRAFALDRYRRFFFSARGFVGEARLDGLGSEEFHDDREEDRGQKNAE